MGKVFSRIRIGERRDEVGQFKANAKKRTLTRSVMEARRLSTMNEQWEKRGIQKLGFHQALPGLG